MHTDNKLPDVVFYFVTPYICSFISSISIITYCLGDTNMDITQIISIVASISVPVLVSIIAFAASAKSSYNTTNVAKFQLSNEHTELKCGQGEIRLFQNDIKTGQNELKSKIDKINEYVVEERTRRSFLDSSQKNIQDNMNALLNNWQSLIAENAALKLENEQLRKKNKKLETELNKVKPNNNLPPI